MTDTTTHASAAPATPDTTPVEWHTVDADDRWPGRWTAHTASVHAHGRIYLIRITPGDHATDVDASAAKDRHTLSETACDLIVIEHRLRDVRRWTPEAARAHLDAALSSVATALDALHAEHTHRTTEQEQL